MKKAVLVALVVIGFGLAAGSSSSGAAPASGNNISQAAAAASPVTKVWVTCRWRRACGPRGCIRRRVCW